MSPHTRASLTLFVCDPHLVLAVGRHRTLALAIFCANRLGRQHRANQVHHSRFASVGTPQQNNPHLLALDFWDVRDHGRDVSKHKERGLRRCHVQRVPGDGGKPSKQGAVRIHVAVAAHYDVHRTLCNWLLLFCVCLNRADDVSALLVHQELQFKGDKREK
jgi:hypothetical protein